MRGRKLQPYKRPRKLKRLDNKLINVNNKTLSIFGIGTYILSVIASGTNPQGVSTMPVWVVIISGIATAVFIILATIRLWRISKFVSILLAITSVIFFGLEVLQVTLSPAYGSPNNFPKHH